MSAELWLNQLHENGYRVTAARPAVVETVENPRVLTPVEVYDMGRKNIAPWVWSPFIAHWKNLRSCISFSACISRWAARPSSQWVRDISIYCFAKIAGRPHSSKAMISTR